MLINDEEILGFPLNFVILKTYNYDPASGGGGTDLLLQEDDTYFFLLENESGFIALE